MHLNYGMKMIDKIREYIAEAQAFSTQNGAELEAFRIKFLGSKGLLKELFAEFKNVPNEQKKEFGQVINLLKTTAEDKVKSIQEGLENQQESKGIYGDLTRTGEPITIGSRHPISLVKNQIIDIDGKTALPNSVIPEKIRQYVTANYPTNVITDWELDDLNQQIQLDNGLNLEFTMNGDFIRID